ncbi:hypothetical protein [Chitinimonas sp.]|uniref:hypothetical protein n=1 Tax=Chitinimonas sp. TaxID=1934313 RepID=UPI002F91D372
MKRASRNDPLAGLIEHELSDSQRADRWGGRLLKLTLLFVFADIALFILFLLATVDVVPDTLLLQVLPAWQYLAGGTLVSVLLTFIAGVLKMSYEMTER